MINEIYKDLDNLKNSIENCKSLELSKYYYSDLLALLILLENLGIDMDCDVDEQLHNFYAEENVKLNKEFILRNTQNKEKILSIADTILLSFSNNNFDTISKPNMNTISKKDTKDIIMDFCTRYNPNLYSYFKETYDRIFYTKKEFLSCEGICFPLTTLQKSYIQIGYDNSFNIQTLQYIAHELGHAYFLKLSENKRYDQNFLALFTIYNEVPACTFEKMFLDFSLEQKIDTKASNFALNELYNDFFYNWINLYIINTGSKFRVDTDFYMSFEKDLMDKYCEELKDKYGIIISGDDSIHYRNSYLYGIGYFLAIYYSNMFTEDKFNMLNNFETILSNIGYTNDYDLLSNLSKNDDFLDKTLTKHIINIRR